MINYLEEFPLPVECLPPVLRNLLTIEGSDTPSKRILVSSRFEKNKHADGYEYLHMLMACVPIDQISTLKVLRESSDGVVASSIPCCSQLGGIYPVEPSVSGYDYVIASWGNNSHYSYSLAEKVWMTLGLSQRVIGNSEQKAAYDDLSLPMIGVVDGDLTCEYQFRQNKDINWTMRNDYLRNYLWMTGCYGVRVFYYESYVEDSAEIRTLMAGNNHYSSNVGNGWCELEIREIEGKLLLQVHASVSAISPELCKEQDVYALVWAGDTQPMTYKRVHSYIHSEYVYLDDRFLERYEKDSVFDAVPFKMFGTFSVSPSYKGQWSFSGLERVGRNMIKASLYELYKNVPAQELCYVHRYAIPADEATDRVLTEEHIVSKSDRLLQQLIELGENLPLLLKAANGEVMYSSQFIDFSREVYQEEGFREFPLFQKLAQSAPLGMYEQEFLSRCKTLNEIINKLKIGSLRKVLYALGADNKDAGNFQCLKVLQSLLNILEHLNENLEGSSALPNSASGVDWKKANLTLAPLFINNDLRNAEAHEAVGKSLEALEKLGFDTSSVSDGYGKALDFLFDGVIDSIVAINENISKLLNR